MTVGMVPQAWPSMPVRKGTGYTHTRKQDSTYLRKSDIHTLPV